MLGGEEMLRVEGLGRGLVSSDEKWGSGVPIRPLWNWIDTTLEVVPDNEKMFAWLVESSLSFFSVGWSYSFNNCTSWRVYNITKADGLNFVVYPFLPVYWESIAMEGNVIVALIEVVIKWKEMLRSVLTRGFSKAFNEWNNTPPTSRRNSWGKEKCYQLSEVFITTSPKKSLFRKVERFHSLPEVEVNLSYTPARISQSASVDFIPRTSKTSPSPSHHPI